MRHSEGFVILAVLLELCTVRQGETKTIVFNSYSSGPSGSATESPTSGDDAWNGTASVAQEQSSESAGRAFGTSGPSASGFPFSLPSSYLSKPVQVARPVDSGYKTPKYIVYPSYTANSVPNYGGPVAMDRFAPGEAYGGTIYKLKKQRQPGGGGGSFASIPAASFNSPVSVAVPGPALRPAASDNAPVVISAPPQPPGPPPGPSPSNGPPSPPSSPTSDGGPPGDGTIGTIPVGPGKPQYLPPYYDNRPPAPSASPPMNMPPMQMMQMMQMMKDTPMTGPPTGPSGMDAVHNHDHHHHDFPDFSAFEHDHYPDIIYDHDHDHYHHHHHHDEPTTPPPPPPPPPAPETPRLKNYSYYYLSRTLWYVPLYFTLYFTFYVAILIIRSIARHKVNLPNQWVGNARSFSSIRDLSNAQTQQKATMMAAFTMKQIEDFREKYL
ncbi:basic salivary proline-rich protein 2-like isoform X3 [Anopheles albimanus]|uniref:basic salivary proline-rich protein 2-like isoform X3 n=1 Tax=Anopheles albimanus TaxID=7167 RepID=UPI0016417530|nr:basic salivary proline-rich protein 2-like isoform X3 [Anopheles albimanus]